jgi:ketosteroid isomerase-like protein
MKKLVMASFALLIVIWGPALAARADDQQTIADLEHKVAIVTTPDEIMKFYESGDDVVLYDIMTPREFVGEKGLRAHMADFVGSKDSKVEFLELQVISDGKLALARSVQHATAKINGKPFEMTFRVTDLWRKTHGQWKLVQSHISVPVDLKTGKADMASKM